MGTVPTVPTFPAGLAATGAQMQELAQAALWCLQRRPLMIVAQVTAQSIANGYSDYSVTFDGTPLIDRDSGWDSAESQYTVGTPGVYLAAANVVFAANPTGYRMVQISVTNTASDPWTLSPFIGQSNVPASGGIACGVATRCLTPYLYEGDTLEVLAFQNSGGSLNTQTGSPGPSWFALAHVSG